MNVVKIIIAAISGIFFAFALIVMLLNHKKGKEIYSEYCNYLTKEDCALKDYIHIGLMLNSKINLYKYMPELLAAEFRKYNTSVKNKITELYGIKLSEFYAEVHTAEKWLYSLLCFALCSVFSFALILNNGDISTSAVLLGIALLGAVGLPFLADYELNSKIEKRRLSIQLEFPDFVNTLILLVNAGMTIPKAWEKIVSESKKTTPLYNELRYCLAEIGSGKSEAVAYEEFGRRCKVKEIVKFVSVIILNLRKGGSEVVSALKLQSTECWEMRKATAKRLGEQASSKLMLPMGIMLVGIMLVTVLPAILSLMSM